MRILNFGSCNLDMVYDVEHIVRAGETIHTHGLHHYAGGKGLNQSIAVARAGAEVFHAGCIGEDGQMLREFMAGYGVRLDYLQTVEGPTGHAVIQVDQKGENCIFLYSGANVKITREFASQVLGQFQAGDYLLLQNEISQLSFIIDTAFAKGMRIVLNPSPINDALKKIDFNKLSYLILNETEAADISGVEGCGEFMQWMRAHYPNLTVILTLGKQGSLCFDREQCIRQPSYEVEAVDTTAAGDAYTGYFLAELCRGKSIQDCMNCASAAAAIAVSRKGAAPSIPDYATVMGQIRHMKLRKSNGLESKQKQVTDFLQVHIADASLNMLAEQLGYTPAYTSRWFLQNMGASFSDFMKQLRLDKAAWYLRESSLSIGEIISAVGYKNESFFRKNFAQKYGCSALEYRNGGYQHDKNTKTPKPDRSEGEN